MSEKTRLIAGAMSGTSADGVDVAIVRVEGTGLGMSCKLIRHHARPYDAGLKRAIFALRGGGPVALAELVRVGREVTLAYAAGVNEALSAAGLSSRDLSAVAAHGQTIYHEPPDTLQWLDPALLAAETGCAVVSDFRRADCAAGGQGAPLVPFADYALFRHSTTNRVLLNIGGIGNVTYIPAAASPDRIVAFDTGPGNCISDVLCRQFDPCGPGYDVGGRMADGGVEIEAISRAFLAHPFFGARPPKSTDTPTMLAAWQGAIAIAGKDVGNDRASLLKTATAVAARAVWDAVDRFLPGPVDELIVSGGGVRNPHLLGQIREWAARRTPPVAVRKLEELGIDSQAKEAMAFALMGAATLDGFPSNVPSCTGARRAAVLGSITPKPVTNR